jgi:t-SNARE complex subunit (syntaxin)
MGIDREEIVQPYSYPKQVAVYQDDLDKLESDFNEAVELLKYVLTDIDEFVTVKYSKMVENFLSKIEKDGE